MALIRQSLKASERKHEEKPDLSLTQRFSEIHEVDGNFLLVPSEKEKKYVILYNPLEKTTEAIPVVNKPQSIVVAGKEVFYSFHLENIYSQELSALSSQFPNHFTGFAKLLPAMTTGIAPTLSFVQGGHFPYFASGATTQDGHLICPTQCEHTHSLGVALINLKTLQLSKENIQSWTNKYHIHSIKSLSNGMFVSHGIYKKDARDLTNEMLSVFDVKYLSNVEYLLRVIDVHKDFVYKDEPIRTELFKLGRFKNTKYIPVDTLETDYWRFFFELPEKKQLIGVSNDYSTTPSSKVSFYSVTHEKLTLLNQAHFPRLIIHGMQPIRGGDILVGFGLVNDKGIDKNCYFTWSPNMVYPHIEWHHNTESTKGMAISSKSKEIGFITESGLKVVPFNDFVHLHQSPTKEMVESISTSAKALAKQSLLAAKKTKTHLPPLPPISQSLKR